MLINSYTRFGFVEGLGDEEIPWWIAPYARDFAALAKSTAVLQNLNPAGAHEPWPLRSTNSAVHHHVRIA
jgi:hypothetical protein